MKRLGIFAAGFLALSASAVSASSFAEVVRLWASGSPEGNYQQTTPLGTATGAYQLSFAALKAAGYVNARGAPSYGGGEWANVEWTGKDGVLSRGDFLKNTAAQDDAFATRTDRNWEGIKNKVPLGQLINGTTMTKEGALAATYTMGVGGFEKWASCNFRSACLIVEQAAANQMTPEQYQAHLMARLAEGGDMDPGDAARGTGSTGGGNISRQPPPVNLMPAAPLGSRAAPMMPGTLKKLGG